MKNTNLSKQNRFMSNRKGTGTVQVVLGVAVTVLIIGIVVIPLLKGVDTTNWSSTDVVIYGIIPTFLLLGGGVMLVIKYFF